MNVHAPDRYLSGLQRVLQTTLMLAATGVAVAQQATIPEAPAMEALAFDGATIVDVENGKLIPDQRVVVVGNRIQAVGKTGRVQIPAGARVVDARGKYLMPGLWDMHVHSWKHEQILYPHLIANGITGAREMSLMWPLDSLRRWRQEIAAGTRIGPRLVAPGGYVSNGFPDYIVDTEYSPGADFRMSPVGDSAQDPFLVIPVTTPDRARYVVDSLQAAGADFIKVRNGIPDDAYFALLAEARRLGMPVAGHVPGGVLPMAFGAIFRPAHSTVTAFQVSDSGQRSVEHTNELPYACLQAPETDCGTIAATFARNGTWFTPTTVALPGFPHGPVIRAMHQAGVRLLAGTDLLSIADELKGPHASLHRELAAFVAAGLTPWEALQTATINPARFFRATDSLGTVAVGKLADLVLLDADPLDDIAHTAAIRAVVANGRYYDRPALDRLLGTVGRAANHARAGEP